MFFAIFTKVGTPCVIFKIELFILNPRLDEPWVRCYFELLIELGVK